MILKISYIEMYVANLYQALFFYKNGLGFNKSNFVKPLNNYVDTKTEVLEQNDIRLLLTSGLNDHSMVAKHVSTHGDTIKDIAFLVDDVESSFSNAIRYGAKVITPPTLLKQSGQDIYFAQIGVFGHVIHSLFSAEVNAIHQEKPLEKNNFNRIDHMAVCVNHGEIEMWTKFYVQAFGFKKIYEEKVNTGKSGMNSQVIATADEKIKIVLTESLDKDQPSQIQDFINHHQGPGIQHLAFETQNITAAVNNLTSKDIVFLKIPDSYYNLQSAEYPELISKINQIKPLNILIDKENQGILYQIFSSPVQTRSTFFFEIIQREGHSGFGSKNIKALFKAIESEQQIGNR